MTDLIFEYCRDAWSSTRSPSTTGRVPVEFAEALSGCSGREGNDPAKVLALYSEQLAPAILG